MDEFPGILHRDFGLRAQGKGAPMSASRTAPGSTSMFGSGPGSSPFPGDLFGGDRDSARRLHRDGGDDDIFFGGGRGGAAAPPPPKYASANPAFGSSDPFFSSVPVFDKPVYDDDGDIFSGVPGMKKASSAASRVHNDVFAAPSYEDDLLATLGSSRPGSRGAGDKGRPGTTASNSVPPPYDDGLLGSFANVGESKGSEATSNRASSPPYDDDLLASLGGGDGYSDKKRSGGASNHFPPSYEDDLLGGFGGVPKQSNEESRSREQGLPGFDDLIPGFGGSSPPKRKSGSLESKQQESYVSSTRSTVTMAEDPFAVFESTSATAHSSSGSFTDPLEYVSKPSGSVKPDVPSTKGELFDDINGFDGFMKSMPSFSSDIEGNHMDNIPLESTGKRSVGESSVKASDNIFPKTVPVDNSHQALGESSVKASDNIFPKTAPVDNSHHTPCNKPMKSSESFNSVHSGRNVNANANPYDTGSKVNEPQKAEEQPVVDDDVWLTVSEIHLFTQPTSAPPPSRTPPPPSFRTKQEPFASQDEGASYSFNTRRKATESSFPQDTESYTFQNSHDDASTKHAASSMDELEEFAMGKPQAYANEVQYGEEEHESSTAAASAAAMKQAMDRAEAKFKHAREVMERERDLKSSKNRETAQQVRDENEREKERMDQEREQREREEQEKEQRRLERLRELELEREREKERARQAVERATREARERAAAEARQKAERAAREQAERAAVQRAQAEARERAAAEAKEKAERLAAEKQRAEAEARERVAAEARERAAREKAAREKAAIEAREKAERAAVERAAAEARARAQRAAVERAAAEARERLAAEARERAAAVAREKQHKTENDSSFFGMGARANSAPKERSTPSESAFDAQFQNKGSSSESQRPSSTSSSSMKRPSSTTNIMDDLTSVFGTTSSYDEFREVEGETEERRRARLEREQRARQRAAKALAEKNERDLQLQREQAERDRISDTLNIEIKRWSAGKEGNLRALLSTLQYVLWPESGWQPVSLIDLITAVSVKKVYRKATLCVHPDKVINGTVQQKYIAGKVFDLLKEAWNKFNSEELF